MHDIAVRHANAIYEVATSILYIDGVGGKQWKRNVQKGARIGPWLQGRYRIVNDAAWKEKTACL